ncbi:MAG: cyclophilin-like fold protein [Candidatus Omnitrophota bacterium]
MKNIKIQLGTLEVIARLNGSATAGRIWDALPLESLTSLWGDEIYFPIPVKCKIEEGFAKDVVDIGDIAYWPEGKCFCIFFGQTPVSKPGEIRPASAVNLIGKIEGNWEPLKKVKENEKVIIKELKE